jgi:hypothetical protein
VTVLKMDEEVGFLICGPDIADLDVMPLAGSEGFWRDDLDGSLIPRVDDMTHGMAICQVEIPASERLRWIDSCDHRTSRSSLDTDEPIVSDLFHARKAGDVVELYGCLTDNGSLAERGIHQRSISRPLTRLAIAEAAKWASGFGK